MSRDDLTTLRVLLQQAREQVRCEDGGAILCPYCRGRRDGLTEGIRLVAIVMMREPADEERTA